ncbi:MAG TPA: FadR family transcriptional regulator [bacterium]|nr:FadR family transcriptional regulator [bacterium]
MTAELDFSLSRDTLYEQVADQIERLIISESFLPGDKLPAERDLAEQIGVSRTVVREAMRVLNVRGLVKIKQGSGTFIQKLKPSDAAAPISRFLKHGQSVNSLEDLCQVRRTLEIEIAALAAKRATAADIVDMEASIEAMVENEDNAREFAKCDLAFHSSLAAATHNDLYGVLLTPISDLLLEFRLTDYGFNPRSTIEGGLTYHHLILNKIKQRDEKGARQAMRDHLDQAESLFQAARKKIKANKAKN